MISELTRILSVTQISMLSPFLQVSIMVFLLVATVFYQRNVFLKEGKMFENFTWSNRRFFAPLYEEILFRGIFFVFFLHFFGEITTLIVTSLLFGIWHYKNKKYLQRKDLIIQILYAAFIIGPITGGLTLLTGTIWLGVIIHFANNLLAPYLNTLRDRTINKYFKPAL